jgi:hypothetical protein
LGLLPETAAIEASNCQRTSAGSAFDPQQESCRPSFLISYIRVMIGKYSHLIALLVNKVDIVVAVDGGILFLLAR